MSARKSHERLKVLVFCDYYLPGFRGGGPITSIRNMVLELNGAIEFRIITRAHDLGEAVRYPGVRPGTWEYSHGAFVMYTDRPSVGFWSIRKMLLDQKPDVIYLNSALSRRYALVPLLAATYGPKGLLPSPRIILAPRGEFSKGAMSLKSWQKKIYLGLLRASGIWRNVTWQASTPHEAEDIRRAVGSQVKINVAPDLPTALVTVENVKAKRAGEAVIAFVGRISPMKNLHTAIRLIGELNGRVEFVIVGPAEDADYWTLCQRELKRLPPHISVTIKGSCPPSEVISTLKQSDILFLPSLGENFAHVVPEALGAGCAVVLSDRTPWRDLKTLGVGADIALEDEAAIVEFLQSLVDLDEQSFSEKKRAAQHYARQFVADIALAENYITMFSGGLPK